MRTPRQRANRKRWENAHPERKSPERKLFNKLRKAGVSMLDARIQSGWDPRAK